MTITQLTFNPFQENTYIVVCEETKKCAIIDCGVLMQNEEDKLKKFITERQLTVEYLLNTHLHLDHCFGNAWVAETYGVLPIAHEDDEDMLQNMQTHAESFGLPIKVRAQKLGAYLTDNQEIKLGNGVLKVIHTPGHSKGGVCFYDEDGKSLISGDTLFAQSIGRTDLPGGEHATLIKSVKERIFTLPEDTKVYPGHGPYTTVKDEKQMNPFF